jgi:hypothetical protein
MARPPVGQVAMLVARALLQGVSSTLCILLQARDGLLATDVSHNVYAGH